MLHHLPRGLSLLFCLTCLPAAWLLLPSPAQAAPDTYSCTPGPTCGATYSTSISVGGQIDETGLELQGYTAPDTFIVVSDETQIVGSGVSESDGEFDFVIHALQANSVHTISLQADNGVQRTPPTSFVVTVTGQTITTVSNILLPTFISVDPLQSDYNDPITISGTTVPGGVVTLFTESPLQSTQVTADGVTGEWEVELIGTFGPYPIGTYLAYASVSYSGGLQSELSRQVQFEVKSVASTTSVIINGYGPPGSFLSFVEGSNNIIGTGIVLNDGSFAKTLSFPDLTTSYNLRVVADNGDQITPPTYFSVNTISTQTTVKNDIMVTTFISVNPDSAQLGDSITVSGVAANDSGLVLTIESPIQTTTLVVDSNGNWSQELLSVFGTLPKGVYRAYAHITKPGGLISPESREVIFDVTDIETATDLVVTGFSAPNSFVTFVENNQVVGTALTNSLGSFSQTVKFPDVTLNRTISLTADNGSQVTPPTTFSVNLTAFAVTAVNNIVLPTFINVTPVKVPFGTTATASGVGAPNSTINLYVENPLATKTVTTDAAGIWSTDINSLYDTLAKGSYIAYARTTTIAGGYQSNLSREVPFDVIETDECAERRSDLNCDGRVDIVDVGILIFYWGEAGNGQKADISDDGIVDITDVGLMMYDWTY